MTFNNSELKLNKDFVEEINYENIKLMDENIRLLFENRKIRESLMELKRLERWWKGTEQSKENEGFSITRQKVNFFTI